VGGPIVKRPIARGRTVRRLRGAWWLCKRNNNETLACPAGLGILLRGRLYRDSNSRSYGTGLNKSCLLSVPS
jgi:hypothetical protein